MPPGSAPRRRKLSGLDRARALPYIPASRTAGARMPRSKSKINRLRHRWKVKRKHRSERRKAAKKEESGR
jgi:hypothetical protein